MPKLAIKHKVIIAVCGLLWAIWIIYAIVMNDVITSNDRKQSTFGILATLMIIINLGIFAVVAFPDISYTGKKINSANRDMVYYYRRTTYCLFSVLFTFFMGGMSISMYYENWRIGFSVVVPVFLIAFGVVLCSYIMELIKCFKITAPETAAKDDCEKK